jgi:hypothetical protein
MTNLISFPLSVHQLVHIFLVSTVPNYRCLSDLFSETGCGCPIAPRIDLAQDCRTKVRWDSRCHGEAGELACRCGACDPERFSYDAHTFPVVRCIPWQVVFCCHRAVQEVIGDVRRGTGKYIIRLRKALASITRRSTSTSRRPEEYRTLRSDRNQPAPIGSLFDLLVPSSIPLY